MKKLIYCFILLTVISCHDRSEVTPDLSILAKQQAPFGTEIVPVKLHKIVSDTQTIGEFIYTDGFLSEHKKYLKFFGYQAQWAATFFRRSDSYLVSHDKFQAAYSPEGRSVGEMKARSTMNYVSPATDSTREVVEKLISEPGTINRKYLFNKKGFIVKEDFTQSNASAYNYATTYIRNAQNNNVLSSTYTPLNSAEANITVYEYDNHPNPFFHLGIDWNGENSVNSFSPNNITKKTIRFENGESRVTTYEYEYLPNGYPGKIDIKEVGSVNTTPYILKFVYY